MLWLKPVLCVIDNISEWTGKIVSYLVIIVALVILYEVISRTVFNVPTIWSQMSSAMAFGTFAVLGGAYALRHGLHVKIDILYGRFSLRIKAIIDVITFVLFLAFVLAMLWFGTSIAWKSLMLRELDTSTVWDFPIYPFKMIMALGAFLLLLQGVAKFTRDLITAITGRLVP